MTGKEIVKKAKSLSGYVYWYGGKRQKCTQALANTLQKQNPSVWTSSYMAKAKKDIAAGKYCCDCSGLVCYAYGISDIGSSQIKTKYKKWTGTPKPGMIAWKSGHVGIIIDDTGHMAEMRGIDYDYCENRTYKEANMTTILYDSEVDYDTVSEIEKTGWHSDAIGWWYRHTQGSGASTYYHDCFAEINGHTYCFDSDGYICELTRVSPDSETGWIK